MVDEDGGVHAEGVRESPERGESTPLARPLSADACAVRAALEVIAMFRDSARWWWTLRVEGKPQDPSGATPCEFDSRLGHSLCPSDLRLFSSSNTSSSLSGASNPVRRDACLTAKGSLHYRTLLLASFEMRPPPPIRLLTSRSRGVGVAYEFEAMREVRTDGKHQGSALPQVRAAAPIRSTYVRRRQSAPLLARCAASADDRVSRVPSPGAGGGQALSVLWPRGSEQSAVAVARAAGCRLWFDRRRSRVGRRSQASPEA